jgi:hypothetical protein
LANETTDFTDYHGFKTEKQISEIRGSAIAAPEHFKQSYFTR